MNVTVLPGPRYGVISIPASKSMAHRLLICAALSGREQTLICQGISRDIEATMACLQGMGCRVTREEDRIQLIPPEAFPKESINLPCGESGSTLRFLLPVAGALGLTGEFVMEGRLPQRPLQPLWDLLTAHGMTLRQEGDRLYFSGRLTPGTYEIPGNISSQYVSGLLFALPALPEESRLTVLEPVESADYIAMTEEALAQFGVPMEKQGWSWWIPGNGYSQQRHEATSPATPLRVEADWSSAAFLLSLGALSPRGVSVTGMNLESCQGDRRILSLLEGFGALVDVEEDKITVCRGQLRGQEIDAADIPDLVPVLAAVAAGAEGETRITHAERLRIKESDRLQTTTAMLTALGAEIQETGDGLRIQGKPWLSGGETQGYNDHRIAMSAAVAAAACVDPVTILGAECTEKSFPHFWDLLGEMYREEVCI